MPERPAPGTLAWTDLTIPNAEEIRDFYARVVGWIPDGVKMGDYEDFIMVSPATGESAVGICHARGSNADQPPVWMPYFVVEELEVSLKGVAEGGGEIVVGPKSMGPASAYAVIRDPAGAVCALYQVGD